MPVGSSESGSSSVTSAWHRARSPESPRRAARRGPVPKSVEGCPCRFFGSGPDGCLDDLGKHLGPVGTRIIPHDRQSVNERILVTALGDVEDRERDASQVHRHAAAGDLGELAQQQFRDETGRPRPAPARRRARPSAPPRSPGPHRGRPRSPWPRSERLRRRQNSRPT